uniref:SDR family oxidoreductase n=1 Tax=Raoultella ornithinolytica TaxID=54291 RepID=UPI00195496B9
ANNRSIAWGIAKACHAAGAELAFTYQGDALKKRVEPLAAEIGAPVIGIPDEALRGQDAGCATRSTRVVSLFGVGSVAE